VAQWFTAAMLSFPSVEERPFRAALVFDFMEVALAEVSLLLIPPLPIPKSHPNPQSHDPDGRDQHHKNSPVQSPLSFFRGTSRRRIAHGATLRKSRRAKSSKHCGEQKFSSSIQHRIP
jgi:hypothetical protein